MAKRAGWPRSWWSLPDVFNLPTIAQAALGFLLLIGPLVVLHELGHYLVARWCGVKSEVFSIGFGKELLGWSDKRGTRWRIAAIPLGGYVQFAGDAGATSEPDEDKLAAMSAEERSHTFAAKPLWQRALIVAAGPVTNLLVAWAIFTAFHLAYPMPRAEPVVGRVLAGSPAAAVGLRPGDRVLKVGDEAIDQFTQIGQAVAAYPGEAVTLLINREGRELAVPVTLATHTERDRHGNAMKIGRIGIAPSGFTLVRLGPLEAARQSVRDCWGITTMIAVNLKQIVTGQRSIREMGGPVKTAKYSGEMLSEGWLDFTYFAALISINLAFINLLPIPTLDGGHLAFYAAEAIRRRPVDARSQDLAFRTGLAFVLALMLFVTINDLASLLPFGGG